MLLRELGNSGIRLPEIGFGTWNYGGGVEPLRAAIEYGACLIDTAEAYGTEETVAKAIKGQRDRGFLGTKVLPRNFWESVLIAEPVRKHWPLCNVLLPLRQFPWHTVVMQYKNPITR